MNAGFSLRSAWLTPRRGLGFTRPTVWPKRCDSIRIGRASSESVTGPLRAVNDDLSAKLSA
jgi:hypothetical protein